MDDFFQLYLNRPGKDYVNRHDRGLISVGTYTPVFCVELACWLLEAAFQSYYSPEFVNWDDGAPGKMNLDSIGLRLEAAIFDEATNTQAFVSSNTNDQVEGGEDQIIVVAFRGSVDTSNVITDLKSRMVCWLMLLVVSKVNCTPRSMSHSPDGPLIISLGVAIPVRYRFTTNSFLLIRYHSESQLTELPSKRVMVGSGMHL